MEKDKALRDKFQNGHPTTPASVLDRYWGGIGYKGLSVQKEWLGYQRGYKHAATESQVEIDFLKSKVRALGGLARRYLSDSAQAQLKLIPFENQNVASIPLGAMHAVKIAGEMRNLSLIINATEITGTENMLSPVPVSKITGKSAVLISIDEHV